MVAYRYQYKFSVEQNALGVDRESLSTTQMYTIDYIKVCKSLLVLHLNLALPTRGRREREERREVQIKRRGLPAGGEPDVQDLPLFHEDLLSMTGNN